MYGFFQGRSQQAHDLHQQNSVEVGMETKSSVDTIHSEDLPQTSQEDVQHAGHYSSACKEAAAQQWLTDFSLSHGQKKGRD